jgi:hypothetical protein
MATRVDGQRRSHSAFFWSPLRASSRTCHLVVIEEGVRQRPLGIQFVERLPRKDLVLGT